jgi:hypothetical protein
MKEINIKFNLPKPWSEQEFEINTLGFITYIVGPNGSGKSRLSILLKSYLQDCRLLSTDRLSGMEGNSRLSMFGDHLSSGLDKGWFDQLKNAGNNGNGLDSIIILEERLDIRIQVEATLSHLFNRSISLEWDSGRLIPKARQGKSKETYRLDRDECHGIKELLVLLTNLYNPDFKYLIIDEPELNLHPQLQAFFMQEVRKIAGDPCSGRIS